VDYIGITDEFVVMFGNEQNEHSHSHYAIQLFISTNKLYINGSVTHKQVLIDSNVEHYVCGEGKILSILFKPESKIGNKIKQYYFKDKSINYFYNNKISNVMAKIHSDVIESLQENIIMLIKGLVEDIDLVEETDDRIEDIVNYIKFSGFEHLRYDDAINSIPLSKSRITHLFKKEMGITLMNYITWKKLINASKVLVLSQETITKIAYLYGFADSAHFSRLFKKNFGISPSQILQNKQKDSRVVQVFTVDIP